MQIVTQTYLYSQLVLFVKTALALGVSSLFFPTEIWTDRLVQVPATVGTVLLQ